ncbi:MAG: response regulator transcription factor [Chloroflexi bacterium]|mgnify:CR=1 FL=1|jgi:two-component system, NarL family, response regulator NreC|nr:response regulator transcription factor [Chloroflexota bacterium]
MADIRILLVDDHTILRDGLRSLLERESGLKVIGEVGDGRAAVEIAEKLIPDIIVMDVAMPLLNGIEATTKIKQSHPHIKIIILSMYDYENYIRQALAAGAAGYILKDACATELIDAIHAVKKGESVLSPAITRLVIEDYLRWGEIQPVENNNNLTTREREVLQLIAEGYTNKEISEILVIAAKTVQSHRTNLMDKLDLHSKGDLIKYAIRKKIIEL